MFPKREKLWGSQWPPLGHKAYLSILRVHLPFFVQLTSVLICFLIYPVVFVRELVSSWWLAASHLRFVFLSDENAEYCSECCFCQHSFADVLFGCYWYIPYDADFIVRPDIDRNG